MSAVVAVGTGKLPVDVHGAAGVLAAGRIRVRRNHSIRNGFDRPPLIRGEEEPSPWDHRHGWVTRVRLPGQLA